MPSHLYLGLLARPDILAFDIDRPSKIIINKLMSHKVKPNEKKLSKADNNEAVKRNRSKSLERAKSGKKLADNKSDRGLKPAKGSSVRQEVSAKGQKHKREAEKKLARASSVKSLVSK